MTTLIDDSENTSGDISRMRRWAEEQGVADELEALHRPSIGWSITAALGDWLLIFGAFGAVVLGGAYLTPLALILIGNRQRALGNLLHDGAHGGFAGRGRQADLLADGLVFLPLCTVRTLYRREPQGGDVDLIPDADDMAHSWPSLLWRHMTNGRVWTGSILGQALRADARSRSGMLAWWGTVLLAIALILRPSDALLFAALWLGSRATSFHLITTFRDMAEHIGLRPGTIFGSSGNRIADGLFGILFHPHNKGYHLARRLNPGIPFFALPRAHALLMRWPDYAAAACHEGYVFGADAMVRSWGRRLPSSPAARASDDTDRRESLGDAKHLIDLLYPEATGD
jgi:fatty acid desaturase